MGASLPGLLKEELAGVQKLTAAELERAKAQALTALGATSVVTKRPYTERPVYNALINGAR